MTAQELIKSLNFSSPQRFKYNFYFSTIGYYDPSDIDRHIKAKFFDTLMDCIKIDEPFVAVLRHLGTENGNFPDTKHVMCELDFSNLQDYIEKLKKEMIAENGKAARYISQLETQLAAVTAERDKAVDDLKKAILPPCKVGDTVYKCVFSKNGRGSFVEYKVVGFHLGDFSNMRRQKRNEYLIIYHEVTDCISHLNLKELGESVFLTREEAEQALKGRANNESL